MNNRITELEAEINRLKAELDKAREQLKDIEETRRAMLYMLEDLNETTANVEKAKKTWQDTFDSIPDPIFIHDKGFKIVRANRAYMEAAGMPFDEMIGRIYYEVFPEMEGPFKMCMKALELQEEEEEVSLPSIDKIFKVRFYPIKDVDGRYLYSIHILEDITEPKRKAKRDRILYELSQKIVANLDINYRFNEICDTVVKLGYKMAWIGTLNEETKDVIPKAQAGFEEDYLSSIKIKYDDSPLAQGPTGRAIKNKRPEVQHHIATDPRYGPWRTEALRRL